MAWNGYIDNLKATGHVTKGAILSSEGAVWAQSDDLGLTESESKALADGFTTKWSSAQQSGVYIGGQKYRFIQGDGICAQSKLGNCGLSMSKAQKCIVVGAYIDGQQPGNARNTVEKMAQYLRENGF